MQRKLLYFAVKYTGNYDKITKALKSKEIVGNVQYEGEYITIVDSNYPKSLLKLHKPPYVIFYKGDIDLLNSQCVSVVGSRAACEYGITNTVKLISHIGHKNTIVSGLALGIDAWAHKSALNNNFKTIAVLGSGIDYIYPFRNKRIYESIVENGLIISEFPGLTKPKPYYFPFRNRLIAALGDCLYVMQASMRSGTLLTVNEALELNKEIFVLPYRVDDVEGLGCNWLILQGANILIDNE